jgi:sulfur-carrier protein adenylyltransferase/sulfurtransferase
MLRIMNTREKLSVVLVCLGIILAMLHLTGKRTLTVKPHNLLPEVMDENSYLSVDQVAKYLVAEDSTIQLIDLRSTEEFRAVSIPGSINVPYSDLPDRDPSSFLNKGNTKNIFYSNGDFDSNYALVISRGYNYRNTYVMNGGLNEWFNTIINSTFTGDKISARENALFEPRTRAKRMFNEINSLPDSLKLKFSRGKHTKSIKLDGGCE